MNKINNEFKNPDKSFSPYCFWFLNGDFEKEHITAIAKNMENKKMSPGYLQDRGIKKNPFLSDGFFDTFKSVLESTDIPMGFCDEGGGMYGKSVMGKNVPIATSLYWEETKSIVPQCFCAVSCILENNLIKTDSLRVVSTNEKVGENETIFAFYKYHARVFSDDAIDWLSALTSDVSEKENYEKMKKSLGNHNQRSLSGSDIDFLSEKTADVIIKEVYGKFKDKLGQYFGNKISGAFMDIEGDFGYKLAYSEELEKIYEKMYSDSFVKNLPLLFMKDEKGTWMRARYRYHSAIGEAYGNFFKKIADWCKKNNLEFTGHTWEENLYGQVVQTGDYYKIQKNFSVIGTDSLRLECYNSRDFMECKTIADKENKKYMCEVIGCSGWGLSPTEIKRAVNFLTTWGVNHVIFHGIYSDRATEKMGFAPDMYEENPYWEHFEQISDYVKRTSFINTKGKVCADTVLYNPIDSVKALIGDIIFDKNEDFHKYIIEQRDMLLCENGIEIKKIEDSYTKTMESLVEKRIQFFVYDEEYFQTESFENINNIVIPHVAMMSEKVLKKLAELSKQGKNIYFLGDTPYALCEEGINYEKTNRLLSKIQNIKMTLDIKPQIVVKSEEFDLKASHKKENNAHYIWLYNDSDEKQDSVILLKNIFGKASIMNCENGEILPVHTKTTADGTELSLHFDEFEGYFVMIKESKTVTIDNLKSEQTPTLLFTPDFTGTVSFKGSFTVEEFESAELIIDNVYHIGEVYINGESCGCRMWKPYKWDISGFLKKGENSIEIKIGNLMCSSLKEYGSKWQTGIHRKNPPTSYLTGIDGKAYVKLY